MQDEIKVQDDTSLARAVRWMTGFVIVRKEGKMPQDIDREGVHRLAREGAQIVEVLPAKEFEEDHLPRAISLPLRRLEAEARTALDPGRPVIVYCWDSA